MAVTKIVPDERKFRELVLYLADRCIDDPKFGAVKLNKLLYSIDFEYYAATGRPVTGVEYMRLENGPAPRRLVPIREQMVKDHLIAVKEEPIWGAPRAQRRIIALRSADLSKFTADEIAWVDHVIDHYWDKSGDEMSGLSHTQMGWRVMGLKATIPYNAVFLTDEPPTDYERQRTAELIREHGWTGRLRYA